MHPVIVRTFKVDVTPPVGDYLCGGLHSKPAIGVESPLSLRGIILEQDAHRCVMASVEYCYLCGRSHNRMIEALSSAAQTTPHRVTIHSVHTHDAPLINEEAHGLIAKVIPGIHNERYFSGVIEDTQHAITSSLSGKGTVAGAISFRSAAVHKFASTRRVLDDTTNQCRIRWSVCGQDPESLALRAAPEGKIDPMLDQITFHDQSGAAIVCLNFYACHPQVSDGRRLWSGDTVGIALDLFEQNHPGVFPIYFDGCGGDVTAGKYTTTDRPRNRLVFGVRLYDAMQKAFTNAKPRPLGRVDWVNATFDMPLRQEEEGESHYAAILADPSAESGAKYLAALKFHKLRNQMQHYPFRTCRLMLDDLDVLFMPAELCVEYQLYAKQQRPASKLAAAAYGDSFLNYVATDEAFDQGGYEVEPAWTEVTQGCEGLIKRAIREILGVAGPDHAGGARLG